MKYYGKSVIESNLVLKKKNKKEKNKFAFKKSFISAYAFTDAIKFLFRMREDSNISLATCVICSSLRQKAETCCHKIEIVSLVTCAQSRIGVAKTKNNIFYVRTASRVSKAKIHTIHILCARQLCILSPVVTPVAHSFDSIFFLSFLFFSFSFSSDLSIFSVLSQYTLFSLYILFAFLLLGICFVFLFFSIFQSFIFLVFKTKMSTCQSVRVSKRRLCIGMCDRHSHTTTNIDGYDRLTNKH